MMLSLTFCRLAGLNEEEAGRGRQLNEEEGGRGRQHRKAPDTDDKKIYLLNLFKIIK